MFRGDRLRDLRLTKGYTHQELAEMLDVAFTQIYRYETGKHDPSTMALDRMASVFGVSVDYLLGRTDNPMPEVDSGGLSASEQRAIFAWRQGNFREAIREIVNDDPNIDAGVQS
jgi:transcriptional regulator with XRE-family HTH domain